MFARPSRAAVGALAALSMLAVCAQAQVPQSEYAARRAALAAKLGDGVLVAIGAREPSKDYESFYQTPSFYYLTGFKEPDAALVMVKHKSDVQTTLLVLPRQPSREVWTGTRYGADGATKLTGLPSRAADQLRPLLDSLLRSEPTLYVVAEMSEKGEPLSIDAQLVQGLTAATKTKVVDANEIVQQLRGTKSPAELALIRKADSVTVSAQLEAMRAIAPGMNEFEVQALIEYTFRRNGADRPSFATIVGSGPNSTTLHYNADDRVMNAGDVVVMDIGASYDGYAADVTRTVPVSGTFTPEQRAIYQLVRDAQKSAERNALPGMASRVMMDSAARTLAAGLAKLGLIEAADATFDGAPEGCGRETCQIPQYLLYYMHGLSHGIGLEVHDPDQFYLTGKLAIGSAFTIEPGVYVRASLLEGLADTKRNRALIARIRPAVEKYKNIGVRIEDDYAITPAGLEWLSKAPRELTEVEAAMREHATGVAPRDARMVESYKGARP